MDITLQVGALVIIIVGLCEALKHAIGNSRWIPLIAVVLGLISSYLVDGGVSFISTGAGVILGLSTTGGYALIKKSVLNK